VGDCKMNSGKPLAAGSSSGVVASPQDSERFARSTLDALTEHVAILDETGKIVAVNRAWREFAEANQPVLADMLEGANYLDLFKSADGSGAGASAAIVGGIQAVMSDERREYVFESPCHCPGGNRWFNARVTRFLGDGPGRIVVAHEDVTDRKHAEEALKVSEVRYRILFETSRDALMTLAPPTWRFTSGNPATVTMFHARDEADFISRGPWEFSPKQQPDGRESGDKAKEMIETAMRNGSHFFEWTHATLEGKPFPATVLLTRMECAGETFLQATVRDISEQKRLEEEKEQAAAEIRDLYERAPCGYHSLDQDGTFLRINDTELSWLGYSREELIGKKKFRDLLAERSVEVFQKNFPLLKERGWINDVEYEVVRADGTTFPVVVNATVINDDAGNFLMTRCIVSDISERKRAQAALRESEETFRAHIESSFDVIFTLNSKCEFVFVSPAWELYFGHAVNKIIGKSFTSLVHPDDVASCSEYLTRVLTTGQEETSPPYRLQHSKGDWRSFVASGTHHIDRKGEAQFIGLAVLLPTSKRSTGRS
jgi:PAS domain S-box-containing protein